MAAILNITDGTTTLDLLSAKVDYQLAASGPYLPSSPELRQVRRESFFAEGEALVLSQSKNVIESFSISVYGSTHDVIAINLQKLATVAREGRENQETRWQKTPVYMTAKTKDETNTRYARVIDIRYRLGSSLFGSFFNDRKAIRNISIQIEREPYWTSSVPQTLPASALTLGAPQAPSPQASALEQFIANFRDTMALTHVYNFDASASTAVSEDSLKAYWKLDEASGDRADSFGANTLTDNATVTSAAGKIGNAAQFTRANGEYLSIVDNAALSAADVDFCMSLWVYLDTKATRLDIFAKGSADTVAGLEYRLIYDSAVDRFRWLVSNGTTSTQVNADALGAVSTATWYHIYVWHDSVNNVIGIRINDTNQNTAGHTVGSQDTAGAFQIGRSVSSTDYFNGRVDEFAFFRGRILSAAEITALYNGGSASGLPFQFGPNLIASSAFTYFPSSPAANDAVYFVSTQGPFKFGVLNIGVAGVYSATITFEVWTGAAWVSTAGMIRENATFTTTGLRLVIMDTPTGWTTTTIGAAVGYGIRARISAFTSWTTSPTQAGQVVYNPRDAYLTLDANQIKGDVDALALMQFFKYVATTNGIRFAAMGIKSRGLTNFTSRLNAGGQNPTGWSESYGTDTSEVADIFAPNNSHALCTFATDQTMVTRAQITNSTASIIKDFEGDYYAYVRCQQIGGANGAVSVRLAYGDGSSNFNLETKALVSHDAGIEIVALGPLSLYPSQVLEATETVNTPLTFFIQASATSATPDLRIYDLILIPTDEWSFVSASDSTIGNSSFASLNAVGALLECDGGVIRKKSVLKYIGNGLEHDFESRGTLPRLKPDKALQIHFLFSDFDTPTGLYESDNCLGVSCKIYAHQRWELMRGSE